MGWFKGVKVMKIKQIEFGNGVSLGVINTDKFKNNWFSLSFALPRTPENIANVGVLANVLKRGTKKHRTIKEIERYLCSLYDLSVDITDSTVGYDLIFKIQIGFIDDVFVPLDERVNVFLGATEFVKELLFEPLLENGEFRADYTESEKKHRIDKIKAEINNKDVYAFKRCNEIACEGTPLAYNGNGTIDTVSAVTPKSIYDTMQYIIGHCRAEAVFAGNYTESKEEILKGFLSELAEKRDSKDIFPQTERISIKVFDNTKEITEQIDAKQGRMVLSFSIPKPDDIADMSVAVFNEIFGGSPVSRLFTNVRERLSLCYYCSSMVEKSTWRVIVRSGIDIDNREKAVNEITRQLGLLSNPENISEDELESAKISILSSYDAMSDSLPNFVSWYMRMRWYGLDTDIEAVKGRLKTVTAADIADIARGTKMQVNYFLNGKEE